MAPSLAQTHHTIEGELLAELEWTRQAFMENTTEETRRDFEEALERFKNFTLDGTTLPMHGTGQTTPSQTETLW